jgi:hypothetical protein
MYEHATVECVCQQIHMGRCFLALLASAGKAQWWRPAQMSGRAKLGSAVHYVDSPEALALQEATSILLLPWDCFYPAESVLCEHSFIRCAKCSEPQLEQALSERCVHLIIGQALHPVPFTCAFAPYIGLRRVFCSCRYALLLSFIILDSCCMSNGTTGLSKYYSSRSGAASKHWKHGLNVALTAILVARTAFVQAEGCCVARR